MKRKRGSTVVCNWVRDAHGDVLGKFKGWTFPNEMGRLYGEEGNLFSKGNGKKWDTQSESKLKGAQWVGSRGLTRTITTNCSGEEPLEWPDVSLR